MNDATHIDIGKDFSKALGPRYRKDGPFSGEEFREDCLEPALKRGSVVVVYLDSIDVFSASFFEEAFGGLVRQLGYEAVAPKIRFHAREREYLIPKISAWMREAAEAPSA